MYSKSGKHDDLWGGENAHAGIDSADCLFHSRTIESYERAQKDSNQPVNDVFLSGVDDTFRQGVHNFGFQRFDIKTGQIVVFGFGQDVGHELVRVLGDLE